MNIIEKIVNWLGNNELREDYPIRIKYKKVHPDAVAPSKAHPTDAGWDLTAVSWEWDDDGNLVYHTGLAFSIPEGYAGFLFPRSNVSKKDLWLTNCVGIIDADYRGEVLCKFKPYLPFNSQHDAIHVYVDGERICQMIVMPVLDVTMAETDELGETERGTGGFGSSGA